MGLPFSEYRGWVAESEREAGNRVSAATPDTSVSWRLPSNQLQPTLVVGQLDLATEDILFHKVGVATHFH